MTKITSTLCSARLTSISNIASLRSSTSPRYFNPGKQTSTVCKQEIIPPNASSCLPHLIYETLYRWLILYLTKRHDVKAIWRFKARISREKKEIVQQGNFAPKRIFFCTAKSRFYVLRASLAQLWTEGFMHCTMKFLYAHRSRVCPKKKARRRISGSKAGAIEPAIGRR